MSTPAASSKKLVATLITLIAASACPPSVTDAGPDVDDALPLDTVLGPGEVRCGLVTRESELIGGPLAFGVVGHAYRCHNALVRFIVQDGERAFGNSVRGGNLIDIDLVRDDERAPGADAFRELVVAWGAREAVVESITVVDDGRSGEQGIIRVRGRPGALTLAPQAAILAQDLPVVVETDYVLRPDVAEIEVRTRLVNESDDQLYNIMMLDFLALGGVNQHMTPTTGIGDTPLFTSAPFIASAGSEVSYGFLCGGGRDFTIYFGEVGVFGPSCGDDLIVARDAEGVRTILVGDGTFESIAHRAYALRGDATGTIEGTLVDETGAPLAGVDVAALRGGGPLDEGARVVGGTRTDADGAFTMTVLPGQTTVVAFERGVRRSEPVVVDVRAAETASVSLAFAPSGTLRVVTTHVDAAGVPIGPLPSKISLVALEGGLVPARALGESAPLGTSRSVPDADGTIDLDVVPGRYRVVVSRGFEFSIHDEEVTVSPGSTVDVEATLTHVVDTTGLIGAEFHQHTLGSTDSDVPLPVKVLENAAEGIEFAASTDHDHIVDFAPWVNELGLDEHLVCVPGSEVSYQGIGHFNVYPWRIDPEDPKKDAGTRLWWMKTLPELFADLRARAGDPVVQINHPRSATTGAFSTMRLDPTNATRAPRPAPTLDTLPSTVYEAWSQDFDAIEVNGDVGSASDFTDEGFAAMAPRVSSDPSTIPVLADYFALLGAGLHVAAMGNSDTHHAGEGTGWPRNFVRVDVDMPTAISRDDVTAAIKAQRVAVGNGCIAELFVGGERPMGILEARTSTPAEVRVRVQAPSFVSLDQLELYVNGRAVGLADDGDGGLTIAPDGAIETSLTGRALDDTVRVDVPVRGLPSGDLVIVALARGGRLEPVGAGRAVCYSAPLYVDGDGGGFTGWHAATETIAGDP